MADIRSLNMKVEYFVKTEVDYESLRKCSAETYEKFLTKAAITLSKSVHPKTVYGIDRDEFREIIHDILHDVRLSGPKYVCPEAERLYSVINKLGEAVYVFARTKKEAHELLRSASFVSPFYWYSPKTLQKAATMTESGKIVMENGDERELISDKYIINLYGHGRAPQ